MSPTQTVTTEAPAMPSAAPQDVVDRDALVSALREKDQQIQQLEAECRGLADQLMAFQAEIMKWVDLDR